MLDLAAPGSDGSAQTPAQTGLLIGGTGPSPGGIAGVHFRTATQSGYTDAAGTFRYLDGESVTFSVADVDFHATPGKAMLSPWQLATAGTCTPSAELTQLLVLLYSLDTDGDPSNGTQIEAAPMGATQRTFASLSASDVDALITQLGGHGVAPDGGLEPDGGALTPIAGEEALIEFINQMDYETWQELSKDTFTLLTAEERSQGVTTDGTNWIFTWQEGFQVTDQDYNVLVQNNLAIPAQLLAEGIDHIGDGDYANGHIYAGTEDETSPPSKPTIQEFNGQLGQTDLDFVQDFPLSATDLIDGCPWVGADGTSGRLYTSQYHDASVIYVYDMSTGAALTPIPLTTVIHSVQGGKVFEGSLYASVNDGNADIFKIDLATGVVTFLFGLGPIGEEEGCVFLQRPDGTLFHTLNVASDRLGVEFRHHQRTVEPLRKSVCP